jgi:hypothetical protein
MVLDDARIKIFETYKLTIEELWRQSSNLSSLVQQVHSVLTPEDSKLLSDEALVLIFDSSTHSMRDEGNAAAHEAPLSDRIDAVLEATLTEKQRGLLSKIWHFAYGREPDIEQSTS